MAADTERVTGSVLLSAGDRLDALTAWACTEASETTRRIAGMNPVTYRQYLGGLRSDLVDAGADARAVWGWLAAAVSPPTLDKAIVVNRAVCEAADPLVRGRWLALGEMGPLAVTAGLTLTEAEARCRAGVLEADGLATLAALRGWVLPIFS